ncbi:Wzz/FepE/Etk N-terminal domain-containing protein [Candidatus Pseudothioglobus singularis]|nr:Wzz/FepE/Etk N-terminal domain-containing protein [Candidatus Pseudothioglobus singularis]
MAQNLTQPSPYEDEIDLLEIFKILIESKKLFISSILIFTIASIIYSLSLKPEFKSSTILEIGYYEMPDGTQKLIEQPSDLISNLKIRQFLNDQHESSFKTIEKKLIRIETSSNKATDNEKTLSSMITFIKNRHNKLSIISSNLRKNTLVDEIDLIDSKLSFIKAKQLDSNQLKRSILEGKIVKLKNELPIINLEISQVEKLIIDDTNNLSLLKRNINLQTERASISPTLEQIIFSYKSKINDLNTKKFNNILETKRLNIQFKILENFTLQSDELFSLEQERKILENQLQMLMNQAQVQTQPIGNIKTNTIKPKTQLIITLGIIIGFITSIFLVFINNFIKRFRESKA